MNTLRRIFVGELREIIKKFLIHKKSLGFKYILEEDLLYRFSIFSLKYKIPAQTIPRQLVEDWIKIVPGESRRTQKIRFSCMNVFLRFASDNGYHITLPQKLRKNTSIYIPYIFTENEIVRFFHSCDNICPYPGSQKHIIIPVIFRLLYGCGLRISEVSKLKHRDVDLHNGVLVVREAKFGKDRLVPMSRLLIQIMQQYNMLINYSCKKNDFFFRSKNLKPISRHWIYRRFRDILRMSHISHKGKGPRAHDLRHSFCVHSLKKMVDRGIDIYCALPLLSTYIGHSSVKATQGYVRLTVDVYPELIKKISTVCSYVIPEVTLYENN